MRAIPPLTAPALALLLGLSPVLAEEPERGRQGAAAHPVQRVPPEPDKRSFVPHAEQNAFLRGFGYEVQTDRSILHSPSSTRISHEMLKKANLDYDPAGTIIYSMSNGQKAPVLRDKLQGTLDGLLPFAKAAAADPREVGKFLREKGVPVAYNGIHLLNPDGSATYYGLMFYQRFPDPRYKDKPFELSGKRLVESLNLFKTAYNQAFTHSTPAFALKDLERAWERLSQPAAAGESLLTLKPYEDMAEGLKRYRAQVEEAVKAAPAGSQTRAELETAVRTLNELEKRRHHAGLVLPAPPAPGDKDKDKDNDKKPDGLLKTEEPYGLQPALAPLLRVLERLNGKPLSDAQQEWLIKSFPMGELVWRMGAHELWKQDLTGKGIKVAVIDTGVVAHPELGPALKETHDLINPDGPPVEGKHGTHVAGIIAALAPDAEIRGYRAVLDHDFMPNPRDNPWRGGVVEKALLEAVDKAVQDGNHIVNMSLGGFIYPSDDLPRKIDAHVRNGVIFVVSAGNNAGSGIASPGSTPGVFTIGSLNHANRMSVYSSYGEIWDPKTGYSVKIVYMTPGQDIPSTVPPSLMERAPLERMSGTSMAAPVFSAVTALLAQSIPDFVGLPSTRARAMGRIEQAVLDSGRRMSEGEVPPETPSDQHYVIVNPVAAHRLLSAGPAAVAK